MNLPFAIDNKHLYKPSQTTFKVYENNGQKKIKLINMFVQRQKGYELDFDYEQEAEEKAVRGTRNSKKMQESISRTKNHIFDLAFCNNWELFFTGTLNPQKYDRENLYKFRNDLSRYIAEFNRYHNLQIKYLLVPELHADNKAWHFHGFIMGLPKEFLYQFKSGDKMPKKILEKVNRGEVVYKWQKYEDKFGFCDLEPIQNHEAVSKYITKYINKSLETSVTELNMHKFYASKGLNRPTIVNTDYFEWDKFSHWYFLNFNEELPIHEAKYCSLCWLPYSELLYEKIQQYFLYK